MGGEAMCVNGTAPVSGAETIRPMSEVLWGIDWREVFPLALGDAGVVVEYGPFSAAMPFIREHYAAIFRDDAADGRFVRETFTDAKRRYYERFADAFLVKDGARTVGITVCTTHDWNTYYFRTAGFLPEYRGRGIFPRLIGATFAPLARHGVERIEVDIGPLNGPSARAFLAVGFAPTGTSVSERWGALVRYTKFLSSDCRRAFAAQFCVGAGEEEMRPARRS